MTRISINSWALPRGSSVKRMAELCSEAGISGIELAVEEQGELGIDAGEQECHSLAAQLKDHGVRAETLTTNLLWNYNFCSPNLDYRHVAAEIVIKMLDLAVWLGVPVIQVIPAVAGRLEDDAPLISYETAVNGAFSGLLPLICEAEQRGISIAVRSVMNRFILSPLEMREFVDRLNSPNLGVALNATQILDYGYPEDWIRILGHRVLRVSVSGLDEMVMRECPDGSVEERRLDRDAIVQALSEIRYQETITWQGEGDLNTIARGLRQWTLAESA